MADFEVFLSSEGRDTVVGRARGNRARGKEIILFEYAEEWLQSPEAFSLEPALPLTRGAFAPSPGLIVHGSVGDSAPDSWGRRLMQRAERHAAAREGRAVRTLMESDYILGVSDLTRLGALRFRRAGEETFAAAPKIGVPSLVDLRRLLQSSERVLSEKDTEEDLQMIFAPGSSLGGARPKASVIDARGRLAIAKFPKSTDDYSVEAWEEVALRLAKRAGIATPEHELLHVAGNAVLLSRRFDRTPTGGRIPYLSAMSMLGAKDGEGGSYPELVDLLAGQGAHATKDAHALYRRVVFNVLISNVDDHLKNHGFLRLGPGGWTLAPAFDLNPVPVDIKARILSTRITLEDATCSIDHLLEAATYFALSLAQAKSIIKEVGKATATWRAEAKKLRLSNRQIDRMASAFEHEDLRQALASSS